MKVSLFDFEINVSRVKQPLFLKVHKINNGFVAGNNYYETLEQALDAVKVIALNYAYDRDLDRAE